MKSFWTLIFIGCLMNSSVFCMQRFGKAVCRQGFQKVTACNDKRTANCKNFENLKNPETLSYKDRKFENEHDDQFFLSACAGYLGVLVLWLAVPKAGYLNRTNSRFVK